MKDQENFPPEKSNGQETTPGKGGECHIIIHGTPSPKQPCEIVKKETGNGPHGGVVRKRRRNGDYIEPFRVQTGGTKLKSSSGYSEICSSAAQRFARIREVLVERSVTSTLKSGFLTPCRNRLVVALGLDLFAVNDDKLMDMFFAPGAIDVLQNECQQLQKGQKVFQSV